MTSECLRKKEIQVKRQGSPVLDVRKDVTSSGASVRGFPNLLPLKVGLLI